MDDDVPTPQRHELSLGYPVHLCDPEDLLSFIEAKAFTRAWQRCRLTIDDLFELQTAIMAFPKDNPVIKGSGGLRKIRFSPDGYPHGKSGSHRACYVYFEDYGLVLLVTAYPKNQKDDLSPEALKQIRRMIAYQKELLAQGPIQ